MADLSFWKDLAIILAGIVAFITFFFGVLEYWRRGNIQLNASLWIAVGLFFGAWVGAVAAQRIPSAHLQRGFAVFLVAVAVRMWIKAA